jgi:hypothetical protein
MRKESDLQKPCIPISQVHHSVNTEQVSCAAQSGQLVDPLGRQCHASAVE